MTAYKDLSKEELLELKSELEARFEEVKEKGLKLDMSRGKPAADQLNLSMDMMKVLAGLTEDFAKAFEERKNMAKKLGEEAGTKLMIPLFLMLAVVFVIVTVPAFLTIQI